MGSSNISFGKQHIMVNVKKSESPDSIPSLAATSVASSQAEEEDVVRVLFVNSEADDLGQEVVANIRNALESVDEEAADAAISVTSSETTEVAAANLSPADIIHQKAKLFHLLDESSIVHNSSDDEDEEEGAADDKLGAFPTPKNSNTSRQRRTRVSVVGNNHQSDDDTVTADPCMKKPFYVMEDPPTNFASCNRAALALTPKQLSEMFNSFEGKKTLWSMRQNHTQEPKTTKGDPNMSPLQELASARSTATRWMDGWMPQNSESMEKECETLKEVLEDNSDKLLNLREAVETQRALNALKEVEIEDKEKELQNMKQECDMMKKEKAVFREREQDLLETIKILSFEIDVLTQRGVEPENGENASFLSNQATDESPKEEPVAEARDVNAHFLELEPFDEAQDLLSRIRKQEGLISELQKQLGEKEAECSRLKQVCAAGLKEAELQDMGNLDTQCAVSVRIAELLQEDAEGGCRDQEYEQVQTVEIHSPRPPSGLVAELHKGLEKQEHQNQCLAETQKSQSGQVPPVEAAKCEVAEENAMMFRGDAEDSLQAKPASEPQSTGVKSESSSSELMEIIASLSQRLEAVEAESQRGSSSSDSSDERDEEIDQTSEQTQDEVSEPRETVFQGKELDLVEVMLQGQNHKSNRAGEQDGASPPDYQARACCCWSVGITENLE